jgi:hypothetical protein
LESRHDAHQSPFRNRYIGNPFPRNLNIFRLCSGITLLYFSFGCWNFGSCADVISGRGKVINELFHPESVQVFFFSNNK